MRAPCKGCQDRRVGCHGECEKYQTFRAENQKRLEQRQKELDTLVPSNVHYNASRNRFENRPGGINRRERIKVKGRVKG